MMTLQATATRRWLLTVPLLNFILLVPVAHAQIFVDSGQALGSESSTDVALGDLDADGDLDAFVVNGTDFNEPNKVWLNDGKATFLDSGQSLGNAASNGVRLGDLDGDGDLDAFVVSPTQTDSIWLNDGHGIFCDSGQTLGSRVGLHLDLGDLDQDGDLDAFVANGAGAVAGQPDEVWINDGTGVFTLNQEVGGRGSDGVDLGDLDGDGYLDAFVVHRGGGDTVWLNDGSGLFTDSGQSLGKPRSLAVALEDLDGDGDLDAFVVKQLGDPDEVWLNDGSGFFTDSGQRLGANDGRRVATADVDGDGDSDAVVANTGPQPDSLWLNDGSGVFSLGQEIGNSTSKGLGLGDLDSDGDADAFVVANGFPNPDEPNRVWLNTLRGCCSFPVGFGECDEHAVETYRVASDLLDPNYHGLPHTGEDWNRGSGNDDLGDPVCSIGAGEVIASGSFPRWSNIVVVKHELPDGTVRWSQYAHLQTRLVETGDRVRQGQKIGTIGKQHPGRACVARGPSAGLHCSHLHFEIRQRDVPPDYSPALPSSVRETYLDPTDIARDVSPQTGFIEATP